MNFCAIDFETAAGKRASACSLALVVVRNNQIQDEFYSLINPEMQFSWRNTQIHGLTQEDVTNAPTFPELWSQISPLFTRDKLVAAHNAPFDNSVLRKSLERYQLPMVHYQTIDTVKTSKRLFPSFVNHKLNTVAENLDIDLKHHHNALADSVACAQILIAEEEQFGDSELKRFIKQI